MQNPDQYPFGPASSTSLRFWARLLKCAGSALPQGTKTAIWLLKITIPVSFVVFLLDYSGWINILAAAVAPALRLIGLSGEATVILLTSFFTNVYSAIAVMTTLGTGYREGTIVAVMCLISHSFIVETAIQRKTGSNAIRMVMTRLTASIFAALLLNFVLPGKAAEESHAVLIRDAAPFFPALKAWFFTIAYTTVKIVVLVNLLLILQKILNEFGLIKWMLMPFAPLLRLMGLPPNTGFLWMVAYTIGLGYGGAIMISQAEEGTLNRKEADLLNHHIAIAHSLLEDTLLFAAMGYNLVILIFPRILIATIYVWIRRLELYLRSAKD